MADVQTPVSSPEAPSGSASDTDDLLAGLQELTAFAQGGAVESITEASPNLSPAATIAVEATADDVDQSVDVKTALDDEGLRGHTPMAPAAAADAASAEQSDPLPGSAVSMRSLALALPLGLLAMLDTPFRGLSLRTKRLAGHAAVVTLLLAGIAWVLPYLIS